MYAVDSDRLATDCTHGGSQRSQRKWTWKRVRKNERDSFTGKKKVDPPKVVDERACGVM